MLTKEQVERLRKDAAAWGEQSVWPPFVGDKDFVALCDTALALEEVRAENQKLRAALKPTFLDAVVIAGPLLKNREHGERWWATYLKDVLEKVLPGIGAALARPGTDGAGPLDSSGLGKDT